MGSAYDGRYEGDGIMLDNIDKWRLVKYDGLMSLPNSITESEIIIMSDSQKDINYYCDANKIEPEDKFSPYYILRPGRRPEV